jgi:SagB-type dehydrogenase family enzyme
LLDADDSRSLALLYHLNSEPWLNPEGYDDESYEIDFKRMAADRDSIALPRSDVGALGELIARRTSCRLYEPRPLALEDLSAILAGTYGLTRVVALPSGLESPARAVPSAGALYPLELYLLLEQVESLEDGLYHYNVLEHGLEPIQLSVGREAVARYFLAAPLLENANAVVVMSAVFDRTLQKYGPRGYRYVLIEAGHAAQNLCLLSAERNLATLCVGGFVDSGLNRFLGLDPRVEAAVYCVGLGHPAG